MYRLTRSDTTITYDPDTSTLTRGDDPTSQEKVFEVRTDVGLLVVSLGITLRNGTGGGVILILPEVKPDPSGKPVQITAVEIGFRDLSGQVSVPVDGPSVAQEYQDVQVLTGTI